MRFSPIHMVEIQILVNADFDLFGAGIFGRIRVICGDNLLPRVCNPVLANVGFFIEMKLSHIIHALAERRYDFDDKIRYAKPPSLLPK